ncbi:hypothetical protein [Neoroseomonas soli]|uniref:Uncharacterized protein n=1 Tax=Neoroseomonas soli TaxID=1081025 RepID=A0A9X9X482_9PROT|nr:hypothetical protein [Neoroseomonas soli]MBR0674211.1 hypothetical protein [Neoroseomonas soli]
MSRLPPFILPSPLPGEPPPAWALQGEILAITPMPAFQAILADLPAPPSVQPAEEWFLVPGTFTVTAGSVVDAAAPAAEAPPDTTDAGPAPSRGFLVVAAAMPDPVQAAQAPMPPATAPAGSVPAAPTGDPDAPAGTPTEEVAGPPAHRVPEDAFPTIEELDAILAAHAGPPPVPDLATRAEVVAALGLDPGIAEDPDLFLATLAGLAPAEAEPVPEEPLNEPETTAWPWPALGGDWALA